MTLFDAKTQESVFQGSDLLAAVLYPSKAEKAEAVRRGRERLARAASLAEAFALPVAAVDPAAVRASAS